MKFTAKRDVEASVDQVWMALTDFNSWERAAMRRGSDVMRTDSLVDPVVGATWLVRFLYRGKERKLEIRLKELVANTRLGFFGQSHALEGELQIELMEMSARRSRFVISTDIRPRTLGARLFLQSLRLARAKLDRRFEARANQFASEIEQRAKQAIRA